MMRDEGDERPEYGQLMNAHSTHPRQWWFQKFNMYPDLTLDISVSSKPTLV